MNVLLYVNKASGPIGVQLRIKIESIIKDKNMELIETFEDLSERLKRFSHTISAAVLFASNIESLSEILSAKALLEDIRIILVLPDRQPETISNGHLLRPRFITFADSDFEDVKAVLAKMLKAITNESKPRMFEEHSGIDGAGTPTI